MFFFFFNDTATTEIYTLSLHDALPISEALVENGIGIVRLHAVAIGADVKLAARLQREPLGRLHLPECRDRKSTRLNSSHSQISYAVFCLKKKKKNTTDMFI